MEVLILTSTGDVIQFTIATVGNWSDFGNLTTGRHSANVASPTRAVAGGGINVTNIMDYVTIASTGNATDFGDLLRDHLLPLFSSTRGCFGGGYTPSYQDVVDYITIIRQVTH